MERLGRRERARIWESLRNPHFHARISSLIIPGRQMERMVTRRKWSLCRQDKNGAEEGAGARATYNGAGIDVITPRRAALHLQLDASVIICTDPTSHLRCPSSYWGPGTSATWPEPGAQPFPPSPPGLPAERGLGQLTSRTHSQGRKSGWRFFLTLPSSRAAAQVLGSAW